MYELPDGILSYIFIEQSLIYGALAGLFIVPFWFLGLFVLFSLWQDDLWEEQQEVISFLQKHGFEVSCRSIRPVVSLYTSDIEVRLIGTPFGCSMYELPDGILSYIFIEQSLIYGALAGLFIVPFWFLGLFVLFSL